MAFESNDENAVMERRKSKLWDRYKQKHEDGSCLIRSGSCKSHQGGMGGRVGKGSNRRVG